MNRPIAVTCLYLCGSMIFTVTTQAVVDETGGKVELREKSTYSIEYIDNIPELMASVRGIENPLCFQLETTQDHTIRVIQDPKTGIIVNAQLFHDNINNLTFIGAILLAQSNIRVLATQQDVLVNNAVFSWGEVRILSIYGHRVVLREDVVEVTFRGCHLTLVLQRFVLNRENSMDYTETGRDGHNGSDADGKVVTKAENWPDVVPLVGYEVGESFLNRFLSSKRRRSLLLQKFFGINQDRAVVRDVIIELDTQGGFKKRDSGTEDSGGTDDSSGSEYSSDTPREVHDVDQGAIKDEMIKEQRSEPNDEYDDDDEDHRQRHSLMQYDLRHRRHARGGRKREHKSLHIASRGRGGDDDLRDRNIFLGLYIDDSRDFSNKTHGLLGQFLFKNVTKEKIRYRGGQITARMFVHGEPGTRTVALYTVRNNTSTNTTHSCWKIRQQGRDVLDGTYNDYVIPNIWYSSLKVLPPPAPL